MDLTSHFLLLTTECMTVAVRALGIESEQALYAYPKTCLLVTGSVGEVEVATYT